MTVRIGPFAFTWAADGDDPGTGFLTLEIAGIRTSDPLSVTRRDWTRFVAALGEK